MKAIKLSMIAILASSMSSIVSADSLSQALSNGKFSGELAVTYEQRDLDKEINNYYQDTAYAVGSIALNYTTDTWNNFSAQAGIRAYTNLWEDDSDSDTTVPWNKRVGGKGDSSERFYDSASNAEISKLFIAYDKNDLHIKVGRQAFYTEWVGKIQDAVSIYAKPFENAQLEAIWTKKRGRVYAREFRPFYDLNENKGVYKLGLEYKFNDNIKVKPYYMTSSDIYDLYGGKITLDKSLGDNSSIGTMIHAIETDEKVDGVKDGEMLEVKVYGKYAGYSATLGYVKNGDDNGWGSANIAGETIVQFEEGDGMYYAGSETYYLMLSKQVGPVSLTAIYGEMEYTKNEYKEKEFDLWAGYKISENLKMNLGFAITNTDDKDANTTDLTQLNTTLVYSF